MAAKAVLIEECEEQFGLLQKVICHGIVIRSLVSFGEVYVTLYDSQGTLGGVHFDISECNDETNYIFVRLFIPFNSFQLL